MFSSHVRDKSTFLKKIRGHVLILDFENQPNEFIGLHICQNAAALSKNMQFIKLF